MKRTVEKIFDRKDTLLLNLLFASIILLPILLWIANTVRGGQGLVPFIIGIAFLVIILGAYFLIQGIKIFFTSDPGEEK